jgi:hypothetical protein
MNLTNSNMSIPTEVHQKPSSEEKPTTNEKNKAMKLLAEGNIRYSGFVARVAEGCGCTYPHLNNCIRGYREISPTLATRVITFIEQNRAVFVGSRATHQGKIHDKRFLKGEERSLHRTELQNRREKKLLTERI